MLTLDTTQIPVSVNTQIKLVTDHANYVIPATGQSASPTLTITGTGGTIVSQNIVDRYTALLTIAGTTAGTILTITDPLNSEAVSVVVMSQAALDAEISSEGDAVPTNPLTGGPATITTGDDIPLPIPEVPTN